MASQYRVTIPDAPFFDVTNLHDTCGYSYRQIACLAPYDEIGIPVGTLATIRKTGRIPRKWLAPLGVTRYKPRPRRAINLADAASAADTIRRHASAEFVAELVKRLENHA